MARRLLVPARLPTAQSGATEAQIATSQGYAWGVREQIDLMIEGERGAYAELMVRRVAPHPMTATRFARHDRDR